MFDLSDEQLEAAFKEHAGDDGKLSRCELKKMVQAKLGTDFKGCPNPGPLAQLFEQMDTDGDEHLSLDEFKAAVEVIKQAKAGLPFKKPPFFK